MKKLFMLLTFILSVFVFSGVKAYDSYSVGEIVSYKNEFYNVIEESSSENEYVKVLKYNAFTADEIQALCSDIELDDVLREDGTVRYCYDTNNCTNTFDSSFPKTILTRWIEQYSDDLDNCGNEFSHEYKACLLKPSDVLNIDQNYLDTGIGEQYSWLYDSNTPYWLYQYNQQTPNLILTMVFNDTENKGQVVTTGASEYAYLKPVINVKKSALDKKTDLDSDTTDDIDDTTTTPDTTDDDSVNVSNTLLKQSIITLIIGSIIIVIGVVIYIYNKKRK